MSWKTLLKIFCITLVSVGVAVSSLHAKATTSSPQTSPAPGLTDMTMSYRGDNAMSETPTPMAHNQQPLAVDSTWWASVQKNLAEYEYHPRKTRNGLQASNRAHNLRTYFDSTGIRILNRTALGHQPVISLSLSSIGHGENFQAVPSGTVHHTDTQVEIRRPGVIEWYKNSAQGLEQGFTLPVRMPGEGPLVLELAVKHAEVTLSHQSIELTTDAGRRLRYEKLIAQDAKGHILASHLESFSPQQIRLVVIDAEAIYPLVIDPLVTAVPDTILESNQPDPGSFDAAVFGGSVAAAGNVNGDLYEDIIVGARGWDNGLFDEGAAFVFLGGINGVETTPHAVIQSNQASSEFGVSVAGAGDVNGDGFDDIIVGSNFYDGILPGTNLRVDGAAFVFHGGPAGIVATAPTMADAKIEANQINSFLGFSVAGVGDVNGDTFDDIIVGVPRQGSPTFPPNIPPNQGQGTG